MAIVWCVPERGGRPVATDYAIRLSIQNQGKSSNHRKILAIYISSWLAEDMRWIKGDRIKVGFDLDEKWVVLERDKDIGYALARDKSRSEKNPFNIRLSKFPNGVKLNDLVSQDHRLISSDEIVADKFKIAFSFAKESK